MNIQNHSLRIFIISLKRQANDIKASKSKSTQFNFLQFFSLIFMNQHLSQLNFVYSLKLIIYMWNLSFYKKIEYKVHTFL